MNTPLYISNINQNCIGYSPKAVYFSPGQASFIHITSSIVSYTDGCDIELDLQLDQLPLNFDTNKIGLGIYLKHPLRYNAILPYDCKSIKYFKVYYKNKY
jgi:hypothetical protein